MATKKLSLRAQARLKRENRELRDRLEWFTVAGYPGPVVSTISPSDTTRAQVSTAHRLGFVLVVREHSDGNIRLHALRKEA